MSETAFKAGSYIHLYNRGVDGRTVFNSQEDFDRFEAYLYLLNGTDSPRASNMFARESADAIFSAGKGDLLIGIAAYSILPKRFHILVAPVIEGGVSKFMQKLQTAYTMYFNDKYMRTGRLFESRYRSQCVESVDHLKQLFAYVHLSPGELFNTRWKESTESDVAKVAASALNYRYTSVNEYMQKKFRITTPDYFPRTFRQINSHSAHVKFWMQHRNAGIVEGE
jgi:putative transposase